jgi:hypothetical protein
MFVLILLKRIKLKLLLKWKKQGVFVLVDRTDVCVVGGLASDLLPVQQNSIYPDRLGPSGKFVRNSTKLTSLEITDYRIKYSTVLWLIELQQTLSKGLDAIQYIL